METNNYLNQLKEKMDTYVHYAYKISKKFPKDEIYGVTSQFRRASLSIILNIIEGYARKRQAVKQNFWEISYGSLQESKYLLGFCLKEEYMGAEDFKKLMPLAEEIGAMLWRALAPLSLK